MSDFIEINQPSKFSPATATNWFDTISRKPRSAAAAAAVHVDDSSGCRRRRRRRGASAVDASPHSTLSPVRADTVECTASTIRFNEDSAASPLDFLSITQSPLMKHYSTVTRTDSSVQPHDTSMTPPPPEVTPSHPRPRHDDLYESAMRAQLAKRQWTAVEQIRKSMLENAKVERDCTFKPRLSSYAMRIQRPTHLAPQHRIYDELMHREEWRAKKRRENIKQELQGCTFRPLTLRAATLKSSALVHDSHIFSELFHSNEDRKRFRDEVQPYVMEQLERHMLFKSPCNNPIPANKLNTVVERLFSRGVVVRPKSTRPKRAHTNSPPFKPTLNAESDRIVMRQRESQQIPEDVVERLLQPSPAHLQHQQEQQQRRQDEKKRLEADMKDLHSQYNRELHGLLHRERRRTLFSSKFDVLSQVIMKDQQKCRGRQCSTVEHRAEDLMKAAILLFSPDEAEVLSNIIIESGATTLSKAAFVAMCEKAVERSPDPSTNLLGLLPPPQLNVAAPAELEVNTLSEKEKRKIFQREILSPEALAEMRAQRAERERQGTEQMELRRRIIEEEELKQCTFRPPPPRKIPHECHLNYNVEVKTTRAEALRRAHIQKAIVTEEQISGPTLPLASIRGLFGGRDAADGGWHRQWRRSKSAGALSPIGRKQEAQPQPQPQQEQLQTKAALVSLVGLSPRRTASAKLNKKRDQPFRRLSTHGDVSPKRKDTAAVSPSTDRNIMVAADLTEGNLVCTTQVSPRRAPRLAPSPRETRVYRDVVSEHAAFGRDGALTEFGRELILRQLYEYRQRRS